MARPTILSSLKAANPQAIEFAISSVWNVHKHIKQGQMTGRKVLADVQQLAAKHPNTTIYAVVGGTGFSQHSKTEIILVVMPKGAEFDGQFRNYWSFGA